MDSPHVVYLVIDKNRKIPFVELRLLGGEKIMNINYHSDLLKVLNDKEIGEIIFKKLVTLLGNLREQILGLCTKTTVQDGDLEKAKKELWKHVKENVKEVNL